MIIKELQNPDLLLLEPRVFTDERGSFYESYNHQVFQQLLNLEVNFVQDNHSRSQQNVLRGLHYQLPPMAQAKLVRVIEGIVFDVVVDIRRSSPNFGQWEGVILSAENHKQLWIPEGFAHGFLVLSEQAQCLYKATNYYSPQHERCIACDDAELAIEWPIDALSKIILSAKDQMGEDFSQVEVFD